ncbi:MAG: hypothetical protein WBA77_14175 [Microcoleaceae cyanobacterium]
MLNFKQERNEIIEIEANKKDLEILISTFEQVFQSLGERFHPRIGASREEAQEILLLIKIALETFDYQQTQILTTKIQISVEQLRILNNFLNEVCNGIKIDNFEKAIGTSRNTLKSFLSPTHQLYRSIE